MQTSITTTRAYSGEVGSSFHHVPRDVLVEIFRRLKFPDLVYCNQVCRRWHVIFFNSLATTYPHPSFTKLGIAISAKKFLSLLNRYEKLPVLDLTGCPITDAELPKLTPKFSALHIGHGSPLTSKSIPVLLFKCHSPLSFTVGSTLLIDLILLFKGFIEHGIKLRKVDFSNLLEECPTALTSKLFCNFIDRGLLHSTCSLNLFVQDWVDVNIFYALIINDIKIKYLDVQGTRITSDDLLTLIQKDALKKESSVLINNDFPPNDETVNAIIEKQIKLRHLNLINVHQDLSEEALIRFIRHGLQPVCELHISLNYLTPSVLDALVQSQITIAKVMINLRNISITPESTKAFSDFFSLVKFEKSFELGLSSEGIDDSSQELYQTPSQTLNLDSARQSPIEAKRSERGDPSLHGKGDEEDRLGKVAASPNSKFETASGIYSCLANLKSYLHSFRLDNVTAFPEELCLQMCNNGIFVKENLSIGFEGEMHWNFSNILEALRLKGTTFYRFCVVDPLPSDSLLPLLKQNAFDKCELLQLLGSHSAAEIEKISTSLIKHFILCCDELIGEVLLNLLKDRTRFPSLTLLYLMIEESAPIFNEIITVRPGLVVNIIED